MIWEIPKFLSSLGLTCFKRNLKAVLCTGNSQVHLRTLSLLFSFGEKLPEKELCRGRRGWRMEKATPPGAASENSSNDLEEVKGGGGAGRGGGLRMTRAAKPQTGRIRHQNDCLVETSNFSSLSARAAAGILWPPGAGFLASGGSPDRRVRK